MPLSEDEEFELLSLERDKANQGQQPKSTLGDKALSVAIPAAAVAGVGALGNAIIQPKARMERNAVMKEIKGMQGQFGLQGTEPDFLPKQLVTIQQQAANTAASNINRVKYNQEQSLGQLSKQLKDFDSTILNSTVEDLSSHIKSNHADFLKTASENYAKGLDNVDTLFKNSKVKFSNYDIESNVIDKAIATAQAQGVSESSLKPLLNAKSALQSTASVHPKNFSFSNVKTVIVNAMKDDPHGNTSAILREQWGNFLEKKAPKEAAEYLKDLNGKFKPFAQAREAITKIANPKTGEFDTKKLNQYFLDYAKKNVDNGTSKLMGILNGDVKSIASPIEGVSNKFDKLKATIDVRGRIGKNIQDIQLDSPQQINALKQQASAEIDKILAWRAKASQLSSKLRVLNDKIPSLNPAVAVGKAIGKAVAPGLRFLGPVGMVGQAMQLQGDPANAVRGMFPGVPALPGEPGSQERIRAILEQYKS